MRFLYPLSRMLEARNPCELFSRQIHMENSLYPNNEAKSRCVFFLSPESSKPFCTAGPLTSGEWAAHE